MIMYVTTVTGIASCGIAVRINKPFRPRVPGEERSRVTNADLVWRGSFSDHLYRQQLGRLHEFHVEKNMYVDGCPWCDQP